MEVREKPVSDTVIPANVRYAKIGAMAKLLYGEIIALSYKKGFCFASNSYFSELYGVDGRSVIRWINELEGAGFIKKKIDKKAGNLREITLVTKMSLPSDKNVTSYNKIINTDINTDYIIEEKEHLEDEEIIDNLSDLRTFLNKGKLMTEFYYKIGSEEAFESFTSDFFIFCDDNHRIMKKKTVEAKFRAYLKPRWETDEMRKDMIQTYNRKQAKKPVYKISDNSPEKDPHDLIRYNKSLENEKKLSSEEKDGLYNVAFSQVREFLKGKSVNPLFVKSAYHKLLLGKPN